MREDNGSIWKGIVAGLAINTLKKIGSDPGCILAGIGPGIQSCHFEIKPDILNYFSNYPEAEIRTNDKIFIDLPAVIKKQLIENGLKPENIEKCKDCTYNLPQKYFSYRRDKPKETQTMLAYIGLSAGLPKP